MTPPGFLICLIYKNMGLLNYFKETQVEMKHVSWPSSRQTVVYTIIVIVVSIAVALFLGFFDYLFGLGIQRII